jgi:hypothetical protein
MADMVAKLGITVDSTQAVSATDNLDDLTRAAGKTEAATNKMGGASKGVSKAFKLQKGAVQQAGFQIQDFAVQVSSGQSALVAFGQQGSQLAGILGPGGAVIGAVIAIGAAIGGVLMASLSGATDAAKDLEDAFESLGENIDILTKRQAEWVAIQKETRLEALTEELQELNKEMEEFSTFRIWKDDEVAEVRARIDTVNQLINDTTEDLANLSDQSTLATTSQEALFSNMAKGYQAYANSRLESNRLIAESESGEAANEAFTNALLARGNAEAEYLANKQEQYNNYWAAFGQAQLILSASEQEALTNKLAEEADYQARSLAGYQEYYASLIQNKQDEANSAVLAEKNKLTIQQSLNSVFSSLMMAQSKELFEIGKLGSIGSAINSAYEAINKTLAQGGLFAGPAALAIGSAAFANVASIASQKFGSTSSGRGATPTIPQATTTETQPDTARSSNVNISLVGEVFNRDTINQLISGINEAVEDGATVRLV